MNAVQMDFEGDGEVDVIDNVDDYEVHDNQTRDMFLHQLIRNHKELERRQRKYKKTLMLRYKSRKDTIIDKSYMLAMDRLRCERNDLRSQIWVADGITHLRENNCYLKKIQCHVNCQDILAKRIKILKKDINNMERGIKNVNKDIYELNLKTVPDSQYQQYVASQRKKLALLENRLEVGIRQESVFTVGNAKMRKKLGNILFERKRFYGMYTKLMQSLNNDKKYLIELMECAIGIFESCIDAHDKIELVNRRHNKEKDTRKFESQSIMRTTAAAQEAEEFLITKCKHRELSDLQPKEYRRRQSFIRTHTHKIQLYENVLNKFLEFSDAHDVGEVTDRFQQQESLYYSYFSLANEVGYHVTLLHNSVNRLYTDVENLRKADRQNLSDQINTINQLEAKLEQKKQRCSKAANKLETQEGDLNRLYNYMNDIVRICKLNMTPLTKLLGDHTQIKLENINHFTKELEKRIVNIVACVYCMEHNNNKIPMNSRVIKDIEKLIEPSTDIRDIVLTQQCPECAEAEAFNMDEMADNGVLVHTYEEAKQNLMEKVNQPEMQYRLHNISQCRLPRSRILAAKRNI